MASRPLSMQRSAMTPPAKPAVIRAPAKIAGLLILAAGVEGSPASESFR